MWKIPLFDISIDDEEVRAVTDVVRSGWFTMGAGISQFENSFADFIGAKHAIAVANCTAALHLTTQALGIGNKDEVICPALTFVGAVNSIVYSGAKPIFVDSCSLDDFSLCPTAIERSITQKTKAIQVMHYAGYSCDMKIINQLAQKHGLYVIEDCAHAPGGSFKTRNCGTLGDVGCFSFFSNKNMTTGEGGMLTTDDEDLAQKLRLMRSHGMTKPTIDRHHGHAFDYDVVALGYNYRMDEMRAALGLVQLRKLEKNNQKRADLVSFYQECLQDIDEVAVPYQQAGAGSAYHLMPILLPLGVNRQSFMQSLKDAGIQTSIHYPLVPELSFYQNNYPWDVDKLLPTAKNIAQREVTLPLYPTMTPCDVDYICTQIKNYFSQKREGI